MRRLMVAVLVGLAAALILAACGQDQAPTPAPAPTAAPAPTPEPAPEPVVFDITTTDFQFDVTSLEVAVGQKVTLNLSNKSGRRSHNLNIHGYENLDEAIGANLKDGESKSVELTFDKPGYYPFFCPVGSHENGGMVGVLRVTGPSDGASTIKLQAPAADGNIRRGPRDVTVGVQVTNFELDAENVGGSTNKAGTGHWHLLLDGELVKPTAELFVTLEKVSVGTHTLKAELHENDHTPVAPAVEDSITFTVQPRPTPTPEPTPEPVVFDITATDFMFDVTSLEVARWRTASPSPWRAEE